MSYDPCAIDGCPGVGLWKGLCSAHEIESLRTRLDSEHNARLEAERRLAEAVEVLREARSRGPCPCCGSEGECTEGCHLARAIRGE